MLKKLDKTTLNRLKIADYLNTLDDEDFHMGQSDRCICGHVCRAFLARTSGIGFGYVDWHESKTAAAEFLGITNAEADALFSPSGGVYGCDYSPHPHDAARVMRYLAATDMVDWSVGHRPQKNEHRDYVLELA